ncbi:hypothetical protein ZIOFF_013202 [Zingiber officinale]|uniref:Uncharacterized protein n=1 Tax=Zingiber officinale TaxID=94328 RepID=A0A8J5HFK4_ZINOF|nr:hypothetical protein ZIOFF_013202 [Zingiber officinale]
MRYSFDHHCLRCCPTVGRDLLPIQQDAAPIWPILSVSRPQTLLWLRQDDTVVVFRLLHTGGYRSGLRVSASAICRQFIVQSIISGSHFPQL